MHKNYRIPAIDYSPTLEVYATGGEDYEINIRDN
jgi:hypothetical protein